MQKSLILFLFFIFSCAIFSEALPQSFADQTIAPDNVVITARLDRSHVRSGDPLLYTIEIKWKSETVEYTFFPPQLYLMHMKLSNLSTLSEKTFDGQTVLRTRQYQYQLLATETGKGEIARHTVTYQVSGQPVPVAVELPPVEVTIDPSEKTLSYHPALIILPVVLFAGLCFGVFIPPTFRRFFLGSSEKRRYTRIVLKELQGLREVLNKTDNSQLLQSLDQWARFYVGHCYEVHNYQKISYENLSEVDELKEMPEPFLQVFIRILKAAHEQKFSSAYYNDQEVSKLYFDFLHWVQKEET